MFQRANAELCSDLMCFCSGCQTNLPSVRNYVRCDLGLSVAADKRIHFASQSVCARVHISLATNGSNKSVCHILCLYQRYFKELVWIGAAGCDIVTCHVTIVEFTR